MTEFHSHLKDYNPISSKDFLSILKKIEQSFFCLDNRTIYVNMVYHSNTL